MEFTKTSKIIKFCQGFNLGEIEGVIFHSPPPLPNTFTDYIICKPETMSTVCVNFEGSEV